MTGSPTGRNYQYAGGRWSFVKHFLVFIGYLLLTSLMTWPLTAQITSAIPGDSFDGWQNYWNLWWVKVALVDQMRNPFWTDLLYYPTGVGLYFHTLNPFNGLLTLPVQLTAGLIPAYNSVVFFSWAVGGYGVYLLTLWILDFRFWILDYNQPNTTKIQNPKSKIQNYWAAFLAGAIFTFSPFHSAHLLGHMQVMSLEWVPFYVLMLLMAMERCRHGQPWVRPALLAGFFLTLAGLCDWYFVLYLFFFTAVTILWFLFLPVVLITQASQQQVPQRSKTQNLTSKISLLFPPLLAGALLLLLLSPILLPMISEALQFRFMVRPRSDLYIFSASVLDFLLPNRLHTWLRPASFEWPGNLIAPISEKTISIGYTPLCLMVVALVRRRHQTAFWLWAALFFFVLALGPKIHLGNITWDDIPAQTEIALSWTPYSLLNQVVPFMQISRSVSRYALMVQLCVAVMAGVGVGALWGRDKETRRQGDTEIRSASRYGRLKGLRVRAFLPSCLLAALSPCLFIGLLLVVLGEFWVAPYPMSPPDTPAFYRQLRDLPGTGAVLNLPMNYDRPGYLLYQTVHKRPLTVAYISRDDPRTLTERSPVLQQLRHLGPDILSFDLTKIGQTVLADLGIAFVVQDRYKMPGGLERTYTEEVANAIFAGQPPFYSDERLTVHQVQSPATPAPYLLLGELGWGPLTISAEGLPGRNLTEKPALLQFRHISEQAYLQIRYQTAPATSLRILTHDGEQQLVELSPAPNGTTVVVDLMQVRHTAGFDQPLEKVALAASTHQGIWIQEVSLVQR